MADELNDTADELSDTGSVLAGVIAALKSNVALMAVATGVYQDTAPDDAEYPFVLVEYIPGADTPLFAGAAHQCVLAIEAVDEGPADTRAQQLARLIDLALTRDAVTVSEHTVLYLKRETPILAREEGNPKKQVWWHAGGNYRLSFI